MQTNQFAVCTRQSSPARRFTIRPLPATHAGWAEVVGDARVAGAVRSARVYKMRPLPVYDTIDCLLQTGNIAERSMKSWLALRLAVWPRVAVNALGARRVAGARPYLARCTTVVCHAAVWAMQIRLALGLAVGPLEAVGAVDWFQNWDFWNKMMLKSNSNGCVLRQLRTVIEKLKNYNTALTAFFPWRIIET